MISCQDPPLTSDYRQLTLSLLKRDFGLTLDLPNTRLCPPIPNRLNYILWLQDLIDQTSPSSASIASHSTSTYDPSRPVLAIDIGTGSSVIYPLLGTIQRPNWRFLATDIDAVNLDFARSNVAANSLDSRIRVVERRPEDPLIPVDVLDQAGIDRADLVMCNPPFFASSSELLSGAAAKSRPPNSACTGAEVEMVCEGGEVGFVGRMVRESAVDEVGGRVQWFSSMLGKLSSVGAVVEQLKGVGCRNWCVTEFVQGNKTRRWAVAWSWRGWRPRLETARGVAAAGLGVLGKGVLPWPSDVVVPVTGDDLGKTRNAIDELMQGLDLKWQWQGDLGVGVGFAMKNVWSRSARRKTKMERRDDRGLIDEDEDEDDQDEPALGFRLAVRTRAETESGVEVEIGWLVGQDSVLFESFCGMVTRTLSHNS